MCIHYIYISFYSSRRIIPALSNTHFYLLVIRIGCHFSLPLKLTLRPNCKLARMWNSTQEFRLGFWGGCFPVIWPANESIFMADFLIVCFFFGFLVHSWESRKLCCKTFVWRDSFLPFKMKIILKVSKKVYKLIKIWSKLRRSKNYQFEKPTKNMAIFSRNFIEDWKIHHFLIYIGRATKVFQTCKFFSNGVVPLYKFYC